MIPFHLQVIYTRLKRSQSVLSTLSTSVEAATAEQMEMKQSASTNTDFSAIEDEESGDDHAAGDGERGDCDMEMEDSPLRLNGDREQGACDSAELELRIRDDDDIQVLILSVAFSSQATLRQNLEKVGPVQCTCTGFQISTLGNSSAQVA